MAVIATENSSVPIVLIANTKSYADPRVKTINIQHEISWADNMLVALEQVQTKYVLIALDDYWLNNPVNEPRLLELYNGMQADQAAMLHISNNDPRYQTGTAHPTLSDAMYTYKFAHYKASLQLAIWDKEALITLLRPGEDPWTFEIAGSARSHGYPRPFISLNSNEPISYINAAHQGHVNPAAIEYAQQNNMPFDYQKFPVLKKFNPKLIYNVWKKRAQRCVSFFKNPGLFYKLN